MSSFLEFIAISLKFVCRTESVQKVNIELVTKTVKNTFYMTNQIFLCRTDLVRQTNSKEMANNAKKETWSKLKITLLLPQEVELLNKEETFHLRNPL